MGSWLAHGSSDVALTSAGDLFWTSDYSGSGGNPFRSMDIETSDVTEKSDLFARDMRESPYLTAPETGYHVGILRKGISSAPMHVYSAETDRLVGSADNLEIAGGGSCNSYVGDISFTTGMLVDETYGFRGYDFNFHVIADPRSYKASESSFSPDGSTLYAFETAKDRMFGG